MKIIFVEKLEDLENIKENIYNTKIKFNCINCGSLQEVFLCNFLKKKNPKLFCRKCNFSSSMKNKSKEEKEKIKQKKVNTINKHLIENPNFLTEILEKKKNTCLQRYNTTNYSQTKEFKQKIKQTCLEKYGVENPQQDKNIRNKTKQTIKERYNVENISQNEFIKQKKINTSLKNYQTKHPSQSKEVKQKKKETCLKNYNVNNPSKSQDIKNKKKLRLIEHFDVENPNQSKIVKEKIKQTCLEKYGVENPLASRTIQNKISQTNLEKYNYKYPMQNKVIKNKVKQTCLERYGVENWAQTEEASKIHRTIWKLNFEKYYEKNKENWANLHQSKKYYFEDIYFDSYIELCFYIYNLDLGKNIKRNTQGFEYFFKNKKHFYFPDFEIDNQFFEIKGNHFLNEETNTWCNPFDHSQNGLYEAKHQCALANNVQIIYSKDCQKYIDYVEEKYGKNYFKNN